MTAVRPTTAVGVFTDPQQAQKAIEAFLQAGFERQQLGMAARTAEPSRQAETPAEASTGRTVTGAVAGGAIGGLLGAAAAAVPGIGPIVGIGILAAATGAAAGIVAGGILGSLVSLGVPEEEAGYYVQEVEAGRTLLTVKAGDRYEEAVLLLKSHGALGRGSPLV